MIGCRRRAAKPLIGCWRNRLAVDICGLFPFGRLQLDHGFEEQGTRGGGGNSRGLFSQYHRTAALGSKKKWDEVVERKKKCPQPNTR